MAIVMRKIYPLGAVNKTQSTWLLMSGSWIGTGVNREPDTSCSFRTFIIKAHSAGNSYVHLSVRAAGRLLQGPSPKHTCSGIGGFEEVDDVAWWSPAWWKTQLFKCYQVFNHLVTAAPVHDKDLRREMHRCDSWAAGWKERSLRITQMETYIESPLELQINWFPPLNIWLFVKSGHICAERKITPYRGCTLPALSALHPKTGSRKLNHCDN